MTGRKISLAIVFFTFSLLTGYLIGGLQFENTLDQSKENTASHNFQNNLLQAQSDPQQEKKTEPLGYHYSFFNKTDFYEAAFKSISGLNIQPREDITAFIVNHHLLAPEMIAQIFSYARSEKPKTIILLSPNHFSHGNADILASSYDWSTPYGNLPASHEIILELEKATALEIDERPFQEEHGITNLVAFVKKINPQAKIIPIIVKESLPAEKAHEFARQLDKIAPADTLLIGSFDFSHYLPAFAADFHDQKSLAVLENLDTQGARALDIDSQAGLQIVLEFAKLRDAEKFTAVNHANSTQILGKESEEGTVSYMTGFFTREKISAVQLSAQNSIKKKASTSPVIMLTFGDLMLDRYVRKYLEKNGNVKPFENIERLLIGQDITFANSEGPFTDNSPGKLQPNNTQFTFNPEVIPDLKKLGFDTFSLANNHSRDQKKEGTETTRNYLRKNGIEYFGDWANEDEISLVKEIRGTRLAMIGYNELSQKNFDKIVEEVKKFAEEKEKAKKISEEKSTSINTAEKTISAPGQNTASEKNSEAPYYIIVFPHWGIEYQPNFSKLQQQKAHELIDAGADLVIGTHPHVIQPIEIYNGKAIFYSLGNFLFDQTFSQATQHGLGIGTVFSPESITFYLLPHQTIDFQIHLLEGDKRAKILEEIAGRSTVDEEVKEMIKEGKIMLQN